MPSLSYYQLLDVPPHASARNLRRAYRRALKKYHPDHHQGRRTGEIQLQQIITAGHVLTDPRQRRLYDQQLNLPDRVSAHPQPPPNPSPESKLLAGWRQICRQGQKIWQVFLTAELARSTEARSAHYRRTQPSDFKSYLQRAERRPTTSYRRDADGISRPVGQKQQAQRNNWQKRTALWLLIGILLWRV